MEQNRYCTECGYQLDSGMSFCPACGRVVGGSPAEEEMLAHRVEVEDRMIRTARTRLLVCLLIYAIPAIVFGIALMINSVAIADEVWADADFRRMMDDYGMAASRDDILEVVRYASKMIVISGVCAAVCALLIRLGRFRILATICCGAAALLCYWSVLGMIIGVFMTWKVLRSRPLFTDRWEGCRMDATTRDSLVIALAVPALLTISALLMEGPGFSSISIAILTFCFAPMGAFGALMLVCGDAGKWINLPVRNDCEHIDGIAHMFGASFIVGTILISTAVSVMTQGGELYTGLILIAISIAVIVLPMAYVKRRPADAWSRPSGWSRRAKASVVLASTVLAIVPIPVCEAFYDGYAEVRIDFGDEAISITAPMFDHAIRYDEIDDVVLVEDFSRGQRTFGYSGTDLSSGTHKNRDLGTYELAAYKDVSPCILVSSGGQIYAFNQSTEEETQAVYLELILRIGVESSR